MILQGPTATCGTNTINCTTSPVKKSKTKCSDKEATTAVLTPIAKTPKKVTRRKVVRTPKTSVEPTTKSQTTVDADSDLNSKGTAKGSFSDIVDTLVSCKDPAVKWAAYVLSKSIKKLRAQFRDVHKYEPKDSNFVTAHQNCNRYATIKCLQTSRVVLKNYTRDYYHANWVPSLAGQRFICAQGPMKNTVEDFWVMVVQEKVDMIVMLCSFVEEGEEKCFEYYSQDKGGTKEFGSFKIVTKMVSKEQEITTSLLGITGKNGSEWAVTHLWINEWKDHQVPKDISLVPRLRKTILNSTQKWSATSPPVVVHCSAGVGRTCTLLGSLLMYEKIVMQKHPTVNSLVRYMRDHRLGAIQQCVQYVFLFVATIEILGSEGVPVKTLEHYNKFMREFREYRDKKD